MADGGAGDCCRCCCSFILTSGLTALFLWLSLRTSAPTCSVQRFDVPALNATAGASARGNRTIDFDLKLDNGMKDKGVDYAAIALAFSFYLNNGTSAGRRLLPIGNHSLSRFYQGHNKNARRRFFVNVSSGMPWAEALAAVTDGSTANFRVHLATRVKYKILFWYTKRLSLSVGADVAVDRSGEMVKRKKKKGIKMTSQAAAPARAWAWARPMVALIFVTLLL